MNRTSTSQPARNLAFLALMTGALSTGPGLATAESRRNQPEAPTVEGTLSGPPVMAIVSIKDQRISLYDSNGEAMRARVSSGRPDYETPVGIYSILQKNKEHYSNVYDDASMPFMQRITWSGVSLHEGQLPGYPASHGCVRMPHSFAEQIFALTKIGMRVIVARDDVAPIDFSHPNLLKPGPLASTAIVTKTAYEDAGDAPNGNSVYQADVRNWPQRQAELDALKAVAAEKAIAAEQTKAPAEELKRVTAARTMERDKVAKLVRATEKVKKAAGDKLARADRDLTAAKDPARLKKWEDAKTKADAGVVTATAKLATVTAALQALTDERQRTKAGKGLRVAEKAKQAAVERAARAGRDLADAKLPSKYKREEDQKAKAAAAVAVADAKLAAVKTQMQAASDAFEHAKKASDTAEAVMTAAFSAAKDAMRKTWPVSIFVSLKTQRIYVRQGHEPVFDAPIAIADPAKPIGTHIFTAIDYANGGNDLRWNAVSLARRTSADFAELSDRSSRRNDSPAAPFPTNARLASAALDRFTLPQDILARVPSAVWPGSSVIVSDEALSKETSNATDFVVLISGEPQGGIKRRPKPVPQPFFNRYDPYYGASYGPNTYMRYDRYGRPIRVQPKPVFWW